MARETARTPLIAATPNPDGGVRVFFGGPDYPRIDTSRAQVMIANSVGAKPLPDLQEAA